MKKNEAYNYFIPGDIVIPIEFIFFRV